MRIRTIKPEFFTHDRLFDAEQESKLPLRIAFAGLWCAADRAGRFKWEPRRLGVSILPYDGIDFLRVLDALVTRGFLVKYRVGDEWFGEIPSFHRHQVINPRESDSKLPEIANAEEVVDACPTRAPRVQILHVHARGEGKGREGNMEGKGREGEIGASAPRAPAEKSPLQLRAEKLMSRREATPMSPKEQKAWKAALPAVEATTEDEWRYLEAFYALPQSETFARKSLDTLLNNWTGEIERARAFRRKGSSRDLLDEARVGSALGYNQPGAF